MSCDDQVYMMRPRMMRPSNKHLNEIDTSKELLREPVFDDTQRINNKLFWASDYSQPSLDGGPSLDSDIITPVKPRLSRCDLNASARTHTFSRFAMEKS